MTKLKITMEIEFSELPDEVREDLADGLNFRDADDREISPDLDEVPSVKDATVDDLEYAARDFFVSLSDYELQAELWAGTEFYGYISQFKVLEVEAA